MINALAMLKIDGVSLSEEVKTRELFGPLHNPHSEQGEWRSCVRKMLLQTLEVQDAEKLEMPFPKEEVLAALLDLNGDKALG